MNENELYSILKDATEYCDNQHMEISFTSPGWVSEEKLSELGLTIPACGACLSNMAIAPNGNVIPCQSWLSTDGVLGNILHHSWEKMWNSAKCSKIREFSSSMHYTCPLRKEETSK